MIGGIRMKKWMKLTALLTAVSLFAMCFAGCGSESSFKVDKEKLPKGVIQVDKPCPSKALLLGEALTQEALRRYAVANAYTQAVAHYDLKKGNANEFSALADKMKKAWQSGKNASTYALYYNIRLLEMSRSSDYKSYAQLENKGIQFMSTAYAAEEKKKIKKTTRNPKSKEEIYAKDNKEAIKEFIEAYPEEKQLFALTQVLDTSFSTACDVMKDIYPERIGGGEGRSWEDIGYDILYRSANVTKTVGKVAGIGIAVLTMPAAWGTSAALCAGAGLVKIADTTLDSAQTAHVLVTGEEIALLNKGLKVTEAADAVCGVLTFNIKAESLSKSLSECTKELAEMATTGDPNNIVTAMQVSQIFSTGASFLSTAVANEQGEETVFTVIKEAIDANGRQVRTAGIPVSQLNTPSGKEQLAAMDMTPEEAAEAIREEETMKANLSSEDYVKAAEAIRDAGDGAKYGEAFDNAIATGVTAIANRFGVDRDSLDALLQKMADAELNKTAGFTLYGNGEIIEKNTAPYSVENVVGSYPVKWGSGMAQVTVSNVGGKLYINYDWQNEYATDSMSGPVDSYDENTGIGIFKKFRFKFSGTKGNMELSLLD